VVELRGDLNSDVKRELAVPFLNLRGATLRQEWNLIAWARETLGFIKAARK